MFEPIHGSAFDITGKGIANPVATFLTECQMLEHLGETEASGRLMKAVEEVCASGIMTPVIMPIDNAAKRISSGSYRQRGFLRAILRSICGVRSAL